MVASMLNRRNAGVPTLSRLPPFRRFSVRPAPRAFTLIEILVVIAIIGVLVALVVAGAMGAVKHSRRVTIKSEIEQLDAAFEQVQKKYGAYPPNYQVSGDINVVAKNFKRYLKQVAPRSHEPDDLIMSLLGVWVVDQVNYPRPLDRGISASEAVVFWLGGLSDDPSYPITGKGGPSYPIPMRGDPRNRTLDPIEGRLHKGFYPFDIGRIGPRAADGYFDDWSGLSQDAISNTRFLEYCINGQWHRINFWHYTAPKSDGPYFYFDVSRGDPTTRNDPPSTPWNYRVPWIYPFKRVNTRDASGAPLTFKFANDGKFQILHCGIDGAWGDMDTQLWTGLFTMKFPGPNGQNYMRLDIDADGTAMPEERKAMIVFPEGHYFEELADTEVNFTTELTVEDAQP
jgi:prepilin-type N-terminal cleavage/methylation domain-containing protein